MRLRFSLRSLFILTALVGVVLASGTMIVRSYREYKKEREIAIEKSLAGDEMAFFEFRGRYLFWEVLLRPRP